MYYACEIYERFRNAGHVAVFGAGIMAHNLVSCLQKEPYQIHIDGCLVTNLAGNPHDVLGIPVLDFGRAERILSKDALVLIAGIDRHLPSMQESLYQHGYFNTVSISYEGDLWSLIRGDLYREQMLLQGRPYVALEEELRKMDISSLEGTDGTEVKIYTVRCHMDREVEEDVSRYSWEIPIQAGAALTRERICRICDNYGENISHKNRQYCELTALYWIWKNDTSDYVGLGHYRRHFEVTKEQLKKLPASDIDVVLTIPIYDFPSVGTVYCRDHIQADWLTMMEAIRNICPVYLKAAKELQAGKFYYAYNMFLMRREILERYCAWLFPLLSYCEEHCTGERDTYQGRYIGFLAEHLMSIYFLYHEKKYKIVHARKHFVEK